MEKHLRARLHSKNGVKGDGRTLFQRNKSAKKLRRRKIGGDQKKRQRTLGQSSQRRHRPEVSMLTSHTRIALEERKEDRILLWA